MRREVDRTLGTENPQCWAKGQYQAFENTLNMEGQGQSSEVTGQVEALRGHDCWQSH